MFPVYRGPQNSFFQNEFAIFRSKMALKMGETKIQKSESFR